MRLEYDEISITQFVKEFVGIDVDCKNLYHKGLKSFDSPLVIGVSNDNCDTFPEYVATGELLKVRDARGHLGTYINPRIIMSYAKHTESKDHYLKMIKNLRTTELAKIHELYDKMVELNKIVEKLDSCDNLIRSISRSDSEEKSKIKQFRTNAEKLNKFMKIS